VALDWQAVLATLAPEGRAHFLGVTLDPVSINIVDMIFGQKTVSASPTGSPYAISALLDFAARHKIVPEVEHFPMSRAAEALRHLEEGKARFRVVLDADF
jgi:alcohol/geraniol dehydrogenase (NADP+)